MDVAELALAGQAAWFELLSRRGAESVGMAGGLAVVSGLGSNTENGVVACRATLADEGAVGMLVDWVARRAVPASLIVAEPVEPELLAPLLAHGLVAERAGTEIGMALTDARLPPATVPGVHVVEVADAGTLGDGLPDWCPAGSRLRGLRTARCAIALAGRVRVALPARLPSRPCTPRSVVLLPDAR